MTVDMNNAYKQKSFSLLEQQLSKSYFFAYKNRLDFLYDYLFACGITDLNNVVEEDVYYYRKYVFESEELTYNQKTWYAGMLESCIWFGLREDYPGLYEQVMNDGAMQEVVRSRVGSYLVMNRIFDTDEIDFEIREKYEDFLKKTTNKPDFYLKGLDKLKYEAIKRRNNIDKIREREFINNGKIIYLGYHPDYDKSMEMYHYSDKCWKIYDLSKASETVQKQTLSIINWIFTLNLSMDRKYREFFLPFHCFYEYCISNNINDMEILEEIEYDEFEKDVMNMNRKSGRRILGIVKKVQKYLFCTDERTRYEANVWYLSRFHYKDDRMNPARVVGSLIFYQVHDVENRDYLKMYIGEKHDLTNVAIKTLERILGNVRAFLVFCDLKEYRMCNMDRNIFDSYIDFLLKKDYEPKTYNQHVLDVFGFWYYLFENGVVEKPVICLRQYLANVINNHLTLSVSEDALNIITDVLSSAPEELRMMFLLLYGTGDRVNEVCTTTADAFYCDKGKPYMKTNQYKVHGEKVIPIARRVYEEMTKYILKIGKRGNEFVFTRADGVNAYLANTFCIQIKKLLKNAGITKEQCHFRANAFRHNIATMFYDADVDIPVIRDYLGHDEDNMTLSYIDSGDVHLYQQSIEYFNTTGSLVDGWRED